MEVDGEYEEMEEEVMAGSCSSQVPLHPSRYDLLLPPVAPAAPAP